LAKKKSAQKKKLPPLFISLKVALGAQEAPQYFLELSLIGKAKIDQLVTNDTHCGRVLLTKDFLKFMTWEVVTQYAKSKFFNSSAYTYVLKT
jgi:hypothetical protein